MATIAEVVDTALKAAGVPILGVSIGDPANRATWIVQFDPSATAAQKATAATVVNTVAIDAAGQHAQDQSDVKAYVDAMPLVEQAIDLTILDQVNLIRSKLPVPLVAVTVAQWIAAVKAKVDTL